MLHNPPCSYIMFLFLKNTDAEEKLWKGSQMKSNPTDWRGTKHPAWLPYILGERLENNTFVCFTSTSRCLPLGFQLTLIFLRFEFELQQSISLHKNKTTLQYCGSKKRNKGNVIWRSPVKERFFPELTHLGLRMSLTQEWGIFMKPKDTFC
jgi:hypothetical protein